MVKTNTGVIEGFRRWLGMALVAGYLGAAATPALAGSIYDFRILELEVTGQNAFLDDFEDGIRSAPPTSLLLDSLSSVQTENGGALILTDADGTNRRVIDGITFVGDQIRFEPLFSDGGGSSEIVATLAPFTPNDNWQDFNIRARSILRRGITFGVEWNPQLAGFSSPCGPSFAAYVFNPSSGDYLGCNSINPKDVIGDILTSVAFDDESNSLSFRYSIDGGASFVSMTDFDFSVKSIEDFPPLSQPFFFDLNANAVPEPHSAPLLLIAAGAILRGRRKGNL